MSERPVIPVRPVAGKPSAEVLAQLDRRGLVQAATIRQEMAQEVPFFAPLLAGKLGEQGVKLG